jgi:hypothetical protein
MMMPLSAARVIGKRDRNFQLGWTNKRARHDGLSIHTSGERNAVA